MDKTETEKNVLKITLLTIVVLMLLFAYQSKDEIYWKLHELRYSYYMWGKVLSTHDGSTSYEIYNSEKEKVMFEAIMAGDLATIRTAIPGADIDATYESRGCFSGNADETVLHAGVRHASAIELLLNAGAKTDQFDYQGMTPLMLAAEKGEVETIKVLLKHGADPELQNKHGQTAKDYVRDTAKNKKDVLKVLSSFDLDNNEVVNEETELQVFLNVGPHKFTKDDLEVVDGDTKICNGLLNDLHVRTSELQPVIPAVITKDYHSPEVVKHMGQCTENIRGKTLYSTHYIVRQTWWMHATGEMKVYPMDITGDGEHELLFNTDDHVYTNTIGMKREGKAITEYLSLYKVLDLKSCKILDYGYRTQTGGWKSGLSGALMFGTSSLLGSTPHFNNVYSNSKSTYLVGGYSRQYSSQKFVKQLSILEIGALPWKQVCSYRTKSIKAKLDKSIGKQ